MGDFILGLQALWQIWGNGSAAQPLREVLTATEPAEPKAAAAVPPPAAPRRSEALSLLAVLQREARLVDFLQESVSGYTDAQIGAAVRGVHADCAAALERMFALEPLRSENEGAQISVPAGFDSAQFRLVGNVTGGGPFRGTLSHPGWKATKCELPEWTGREDSALVVAPAEVEVK